MPTRSLTVTVRADTDLDHDALGDVVAFLLDASSLTDADVDPSAARIIGVQVHAPLPQPDAETRPAAHRGGRDTEWEAHHLAVPRAGTLREKVLDVLYAYSDGLTDAEISERTGVYRYSIAPRRTELVHMGWVQDSGRRRAATGGNHAVVWTLTPEGAAKYDETVGA